MNKYLLMSVAALLASSAGAGASSHHGTAIVSLNYCSYFELHWKGALYAVRAVATETCKTSSYNFEAGLAGGKKDKASVSFPIPTTEPHLILTLDLSLPIRQDGTWLLYGSTNGTTAFVFNSGDYGVRRPGGHKPRSRTSLGMKVKELLEEAAAKQ
jgi:hypothetical protein